MCRFIHLFLLYEIIRKVPKVGSREWLKWTSDESGKVEMPVKELNSRGLSQFSNQIALDCQENWPFPIKQLNTNFGKKLNFSLE